jgi:hypothetical protein
MSLRQSCVVDTCFPPGSTNSVKVGCMLTQVVNKVHGGSVGQPSHYNQMLISMSIIIRRKQLDMFTPFNRFIMTLLKIDQIYDRAIFSRRHMC